MFIAVVSLTLLGSAMGLFLGYSARKLEVEGNPLVAEIQAILPGSQCGQCGFPGCAGAAQALADRSAPVTLCPPGGRAVVQALALKLGIEANLSDVKDSVPMIAEVKEEICIGCTRCFKVCHHRRHHGRGATDPCRCSARPAPPAASARKCARPSRSSCSRYR